MQDMAIDTEHPMDWRTQKNKQNDNWKIIKVDNIQI